MRIEYEGIVEQQPTYQHVGYTAAASIRPNSEPTAQVGLGLFALGVMVALMAYGRWRHTAGPAVAVAVGVIGLLMLVGGGILAATAGGVTEKYYPTPYHQTELRLKWHDRKLQEKLSLGEELPTSTWDRPSDDIDIEYYDVDGWGTPFNIDSDPGSDFGHPFNVISAGADGEFGTVDDIDLSVIDPEPYEQARLGNRAWPEKPRPLRYWNAVDENAH